MFSFFFALHTRTPRYNKLLLTILLLFAWFPVTTFASKTRILATVNGQAITEQNIVRVVPKAANNPALLKQSLQRYINTILIYDDAKRLRLEATAKNGGVPQKEGRELLIRAAEKHWLDKHPVTNQDIKNQYQKYINHLPENEWRLRAIITLKRVDAMKVISELRHGANFSVLAEQHPASPNSTLGGEMGWVDPNSLDASIRHAVSPLKTLEITGPVSVPKGLAIIQLLGIRKTPRPSLNSVLGLITKQLQEIRLADYASNLRNHAHIVYTHIKS